MATAPVDVKVQNFPPSTTVNAATTLLSQVTFQDRLTRQLIDPDDVWLVQRVLPGTVTTYKFVSQVQPGIVKIQIGAYQLFIPPGTEADKWRLSWLAISNPGTVIVGSAHTILDVVPEIG